MTKIFPLSEVKIKLSKLIQNIIRNDDEIVITLNGKPAAVLMNVEEFESWKETCEIMSDPDFFSDIKKGVEDIKSGKFKSYKSVDALFKSIE
jgi:antitoxin YefM